MKRWVFLIALGVAGGLFIRQFLCEGIYVASASMEPTLPVGGHYFMDRITYLFRPPRRGEIVVFPSPVKPDVDLLKRVVGLPGETIEIRDKKVFIGGRPLEEPYAVFKRQGEILMDDNIAPTPIPERAYFLMGDNRDESGDSRDWKDPQTGRPPYCVPADKIKGRILNPVP